MNAVKVDLLGGKPSLHTIFTIDVILRELKKLLSWNDLKNLRAVSNVLNEVILYETDFVAKTKLHLDKSCFKHSATKSLSFQPKHVALYFKGIQGPGIRIAKKPEITAIVSKLAQTCETVELWHQKSRTGIAVPEFPARNRRDGDPNIAIFNNTEYKIHIEEDFFRTDRELAHREAEYCGAARNGTTSVKIRAYDPQNRLVKSVMYRTWTGFSWIVTEDGIKQQKYGSPVLSEEEEGGHEAPWAMDVAEYYRERDIANNSV